MRLTKKQIEIIRENTPKELKGQHASIEQDFGYFMKSGANWAYCAGYITRNNTKYLVVTVFGEII